MSIAYPPDDRSPCLATATPRGRGCAHPAGARPTSSTWSTRCAPVPTCAAGSWTIHPETADAATIVIRPGKDWAGHVPGQYVRIGIDVDGVRQWRAYSLTHGPRADGLISITVKAVPDGKVSNHLVHDARPGTLVHLEQAAGEFVLPTRGRQAPVRHRRLRHHPGHRHAAQPLPRHRQRRASGCRAAATSTSSSSTWRRASRDSIFLDNLKRPRRKSGAIPLVARYDDVHGILDVADLADLVPDLAERTTYACGPAGLLDALEAPPRRARADRCSPSSSAPPRVVAGEGGTVTLRPDRHHRRGRRRHPDPRRRRGRRRPDAERLPDGHLLRLRPAAARGRRARPAQRRDHHRPPAESDDGGVLIQTCINAAAGACDIDH